MNEILSLQTIDAISKAKSIQTDSSLQFIFITDTHHTSRSNQLHAARIVRQIADRVPLDFIAFGGDVSVNGDKRTVMDSQAEMIEALTIPSCPLLAVKGNHDDNSIQDFYNDPNGTSNVIFPEETFGLMLQQLDSIVEFDPLNPGGLYYYYDVPRKKTRVVLLNCIDIPYIIRPEGGLEYNGQWKYAFSGRQLQWVAETALDLNGKPDRDEWTVLFVSHVALLQDGVFGCDHSIVNEDVMWGILQAFRTGSSYVSVPTEGHFAQSVAVDYAQQGPGKIIASLFGHVHFDQAIVREQIPMISTLNCCTHRDFEEAPAREKGTDSAIAFDIVTVNVQQGKMYMTRVGAGEDREIKLPFAHM